MRFPQSLLLITFSLLACAASYASPVFETVRTFEIAPKNPNLPKQAVDGYFYGVTGRGGVHDYGTVFRMAADGDYTTLAQFNPEIGQSPGVFFQAIDGNFYGITQTQGPGGRGSIFRITPSGALTCLATFNGSNGSSPGSLIQANDGNFYGTTTGGGSQGYGTAFRLTPAGTLTTLVHFSFTQRTPIGLVQHGNGDLYGCTRGGANGLGMVYKLTLEGTFTKLADFTGSGGPAGGAPLLLGHDGTLYGMDSSGGLGGLGSFFKVGENGAVTKLADFGFIDAGNPQGQMVQASDGNFYGTTLNGQKPIAFKVTPQGNLTKLADLDGVGIGFSLGNDGNLYGAAVVGGTQGAGMLYRMTLNGIQTMLVDYQDDQIVNPTGGLAKAADGYLYGTASGGKNRFYKLSPDDNLMPLPAAAGHQISSDAPMIQGTDGDFFGTDTTSGVLYRITPDGEYSVLADVSSNIGPPIGGVIQASDGNFYGATIMSLTDAQGSIYRVTPAGAITRLVDFNSANGSMPYSGLFEASDGFLYGTTFWGGSNEMGTVFKMTKSGNLTTLAHFNGSDGSHPMGALMQARDGNLYGTTSEGGMWGGGTIFRLTPEGDLTTVAHLHSTSGVGPWAALIQGRDGNFYGTTEKIEPGGSGAVFRMTPEGDVSTVVEFNDSNGNSPLSALVQGNDGHLYGTMSRGGISPDGRHGGGGAIYRLKFSPSIITLAASNISGTAATLNANLDPGGDSALVAFHYGTDPTLSSYSQASITGGSGPHLEVSLSGLSGGTTYYFRIVASIEGSSLPQQGTILNFTTFGTPGFEAWRQVAFGSENPSPESSYRADPDEDGLINLLEYAFNLSPTLPDAAPAASGTALKGLPRLLIADQGATPILRIEYIRLKQDVNPGINYTVQFSSGLQSMDWEETTETETVIPIDENWERVSVEDVGGSRRFGRVKVSVGQ